MLVFAAFRADHSFKVNVPIPKFWDRTFLNEKYLVALLLVGKEETTQRFYVHFFGTAIPY